MYATEQAFFYQRLYLTVITCVFGSYHKVIRIETRINQPDSVHIS
jgi:hypothetical protein